MNNSIYDKHTFSYLSLRKAVGFIAIFLPFVLILLIKLGLNEPLCEQIQPSISHFYYTCLRDILVGSICAIALFMFFYTGYDWKDNWAGNLAGFFALGVAWFPTPPVGSVTDTKGWIHFISATLLFFTLSYFALFLFTKGQLPIHSRTKNKKLRNKIYRICGSIILLSIAFLAYVFYKNLDETSSLPLVFIGETVALFAFGFSWLVKGEFIIKDKINNQDN